MPWIFALRQLRSFRGQDRGCMVPTDPQILTLNNLMKAIIPVYFKTNINLKKEQEMQLVNSEYRLPLSEYKIENISIYNVDHVYYDNDDKCTIIVSGGILLCSPLSASEVELIIDKAKSLEQNPFKINFS